MSIANSRVGCVSVDDDEPVAVVPPRPKRKVSFSEASLGNVIHPDTEVERTTGTGEIDDDDGEISIQDICGGSGHISEASYDLVWERDGGSRRSLSRSATEGDLNETIGDLSDSMLEDIYGIEDFHSSLEVDELNVSHEFVHFSAPKSPSQGLKRCNHLVGSKGRLVLSSMGYLVSPKSNNRDKKQLGHGLSPKSPQSAAASRRTLSRADFEVQLIGSLIQSLRLLNDSNHSRTGSLDMSRCSSPQG